MQDRDNTRQTDEVAQALRNRDLDTTPVTEAERALLRFVKLLTEQAHRTSDADVAAVRQAGWSDPQIAEAVYVTAMFAFFNRVADAFGLEDPNYEQALGGLKPGRFPADDAGNA